MILKFECFSTIDDFFFSSEGEMILFEDSNQGFSDRHFAVF
jgi:hypothetical protein